MSFIEMNDVGSAKEPESVDEGNYGLTISFMSEEPSKAGKPMITLGLEINDHPDAAMVYHYVSLPDEEDEDKARQFKNLNANRFFTLAGVDISEGLDTEDLYGVTFDGFLTKEEIEQEDPEAPPAFRNVLKVPKLAA